MKCSHLCCALLLFVVGLGQSPSNALAADDQTAKSYSARGVVEKIAPDRREITIHHQAIPGYMMEMTMDFPVKNTKELKDVLPGDKITFTLVVGKAEDWIENVQIIEHSKGAKPAPTQMASAMVRELKPGDLMPDSGLVAEDGSSIHFSEFHGRAVAFTFFFTRCPLPNYCPLMNRNFAAARDLILSMPNAPVNWLFLSISFDPTFDSPKTLKNYAGLYRGDNSDRWLFAAASTKSLADLAPRLDLMIMRQGASISHNLRTVVLDPHGRIYRQFDGNEWTPQQLADALVEAALRKNKGSE